MDCARAAFLHFRDGRPGKKNLQAFLKRHEGSIRLNRKSSQEAIRWVSTNSDTLKSHFTAIECIIRENNIDGSRMAKIRRVWYFSGTGSYWYHEEEGVYDARPKNNGCASYLRLWSRWEPSVHHS